MKKKSKDKKNKETLKSIVSSWFVSLAPAPSAALAWIGAGWCVAFFALLALIDFHPIVKLRYSFDCPLVPFWIVFLLLAIGAAAMAAGFRRLPEKEAPEISRKNAWIWLAAIFTVGAILRLWRMGEPPVGFWDDWAECIVWANIMRDKDRLYLMFPTDGREPFYPFALAGMMTLLPSSIRDLTVMHITNCLIDLTALWLLYLSGKELGSRRIGLVAAALGATAKPMLQLTLTGMRVFSITLAVAFLLFATLKMLRKPKLSHFLLWTASLVFGVHTYSTFRPFMIILPFFLLAWALAEREERRFNAVNWAAALGAALLLLGIYSDTFASAHPAFSGFGNAWKALAGWPWAMAGLFTACLSLSVWAVRKTWRKGNFSRLAGWSLAVGLASLLVYPISRTEGFTLRMANLSPFHKGLVEDLWFYLADQSWKITRAIFYYCEDRPDLKVGSGPYYDLYSQGALILGLAFLLALPHWKKAFLLALGALGTVVYAVSVDPASSKLTASAAPLFLLAGWAVSRLWAGFPRLTRKGDVSLAPTVLTGLLVLYGTWGAMVQYEKLYHFWAKQGMLNDTVLARQIAELEPKYRVYVAHSPWFFGWSAQFVLNEGKRFYLLKDNNTVPEQKNGALEDIVVLVFGADEENQKKLRHDFPSAQWEKVLISDEAYTNPNPELYIWRVMIPRTSLSKDPNALLFNQQEDGPWLRRYYNPYFGWGLSGIVREVKTVRFSEPIPFERLFSKSFDKYQNGRLVRIMGTLEVEKTGKYEWSCVYQDPMWMKIDGKTLWKRDAPGGGGKYTSSIRLEKGTHQVEARVRMVTNFMIPDVQWREKGETNWKNL